MPRSCNSILSAASIRATSSEFRDETFRISQVTFSLAGRDAAILRASSFAESSRVAQRAAFGIAIIKNSKRIARRERVVRSEAIIGVLRPAPRNMQKSSARRPGLREIIAQPFGGAGNLPCCVVQYALAFVAQALLPVRFSQFPRIEKPPTTAKTAQAGVPVLLKTRNRAPIFFSGRGLR